MDDKILQSTPENIKKGAEILKNGGLVAFPTETVYGLGACTFDPVAVAKIFAAKKRPYFDPLITHISDPEMVDMLSAGHDRRIDELIERFWPGPLTLVVPKRTEVPDIVTSGLGTVAIRMPDHPVALKLIHETGAPVSAPSANLFGRLSPTDAAHVYSQLGDSVDMILDGGQCRVGVESTIITIESDSCRLLRPGGVPVEEIEEIIGEVEKSFMNSDLTEAPGQLPYHYSPVTPVRIIDNSKDFDFTNSRAAFILFDTMYDGAPKERSALLSPGGDLCEAASRIFSLLHHFDEGGYDVIYAEKVPQQGLGMAIMDRLVKASKKTI